jgi:hypothetical protein
LNINLKNALTPVGVDAFVKHVWRFYMFDEESVIKKVTEREDYFSILMENSWGFGLAKKYGVTPKVGDRIKIDTTCGTEVFCNRFRRIKGALHCG